MEFKFRAWDAFMPNKARPLCLPECHYKDTAGGSREHFMMHFTGLQDCNGVDIYAGDILKGDSKVFNKVCGEVVISAYEDCEAYQHKTHYGWNVNGIPIVDLIEDGLKVIGNIHQNPDLLEVNND